ncbi:MAG TPA: cytosolic protein [Cerasibacillus sp.]|uniref:cytosolic protein n=1 Tax=Cerasibacillus sp. TaxID=2498711 RepID=UPI002F3F54E6
MSLKKIFSKHSETHDQHKNKELKTRYYKTTSKEALNILKNICQQTLQATIHAISEERGELSISIINEGKKAFVVASVVMVQPYQTAIDFTVTTETAFPFDFGYSTKVIKSLYDALDQRLPLLETN